MKEALERIKGNFRRAFKSVRFNFSKYLPFFVALLLIRLFFGTVLFSSDCAAVKEKEIKRESYFYHMICHSLNDSQYYYLLRYAGNEGNSLALFSIVETVESEGYPADDAHTDVYIRFEGEDPEEDYRAFLHRFQAALTGYSDGNRPPRLTLSPAIDGGFTEAKGLAVPICMGLSVLSFLLLTVLYTVRIHHYRFEYGVYMTFGADFKRLSENSLYEMAVIDLLAFPPSFLLSFIGASLLHGRIVFRLGSFLVLLILPLLLALASVFFPMFTLSRAYPMSHLLGEDNSRLVISPRKSFSLLNRSFKKCYERFSLFRFRKYYRKTLLVTAALVALSSAVSYAAELVSVKEEAASPQFRIDFDGEEVSYDGDFSQWLLSLDGVAYTNKLCEADAVDINSHLMFTAGQTDPLSGFSRPYGQTPYSRGTDSVIFRACDGEELSYLETYTVVGDPERLLTEENTVILGENVMNSRKIRPQPGDTVYAAIPTGKYNPDSKVGLDDVARLSGKELFRARLELYTYRYLPLKVVAVVKDFPAGSRLPVYLSEQTYKSLVFPAGEETEEETETETETEEEISYSRVSVYTDPTLSEEEILSLEKTMRGDLSGIPGVSVTNLRADADARTLRAMKIPSLCVIVSLLIFFLSLLYWLFSQVVFYRKRFEEMKILHAIGATDRDLRGLFLTGGGWVSLLAALLAAAFSALFFPLMNRAVNLVEAGNVYYPFSFPLPLFLAAILGSAVSAAASVFLSYRLFRRENAGESSEAGEFSEE